MKRTVLLIATAALAAPAFAQKTDPAIERGRYIAKIGGCNDCHTAGYPQKGGQVPEAQWLTGDAIGFRGPWGTTYPTNLRLRVHQMSESQWVTYAKNLQSRPPMPWFNVRAMSEVDLRAFYKFVRGLGPPGDPAPAYLAPNVEPKTPYIVFVPKPPG
jgi:mono/diheme cytochrome c family protein